MTYGDPLLTIYFSNLLQKVLRVSGNLREAETGWVSGKARGETKTENGENWPSVLLEVGMERAWDEMVDDMNAWLQHSTNLTQAVITIKISPKNDKKSYRAQLQAWVRNHEPPFNPIPLLDFPAQFGSDVEAQQWTRDQVKIPWKYFYASDPDVLSGQGLDPECRCRHLELSKALHTAQIEALPDKARGDFILDLLALHSAIEPILFSM